MRNGSGDIHMFAVDRQTDERITTINGWVRLFYCLKKISSPTHYANFALLICFVRRGINRGEIIAVAISANLLNLRILNCLAFDVIFKIKYFHFPDNCLIF
jgi:hypothetical protein